MKKVLLFMIAIAGYTIVSAQEMIKGGDMENSSAWTIIDVSSYGLDPSTITFGYTFDTPKDGTGGCLSIAGYGVTRNFIYQKVTLTKGHTYMISAALKDDGDTSLSNYWVEVNLVKKKPVLSGTGTSADFGATNYDFQIGMNYWKTVDSTSYNRLTSYDGLIQNTLPLEWLHAGKGGTADSVITDPRNPAFHGAHGDSAIFTLPDTVSTTTWYVLIKVGAFMTAGQTTPAYDWLIDNLSLWDMAQPLPSTSAIKNTKTNSHEFSVYPNPSNGIVNVRSTDGSALTYNIYNLLGKMVKTGRLDNSSTINLTNMSKGLYFISVSNGVHTEEYKLMLK